MMPTLREALMVLMSNDSELMAMIDDEHIYCEKLPPSFVRPAILFTRIDGNIDEHLDGTTGFEEVRMSFDIYAEEDEQELVESIKDELLDLLIGGYRLIMVNGQAFNLIDIGSASTGAYLPDPGEEGLRYGALDFYIKYGR